MSARLLLALPIVTGPAPDATVNPPAPLEMLRVVVDEDLSRVDAELEKIMDDHVGTEAPINNVEAAVPSIKAWLAFVQFAAVPVPLALGTQTAVVVDHVLVAATLFERY